MVGPLPPVYGYVHVPAGAVTAELISSTPIVVHTVTVNTGVAGGTVTLYDSATTAGAGAANEIAVIDGSKVGTLTYDIATQHGLVLTTTGATIDLTITTTAVPAG